MQEVFRYTSMSGDADIRSGTHATLLNKAKTVFQLTLT